MHTTHTVNRSQTEVDWCVRCGVRHGSKSPCPLVSHVASPERNAWQGVYTKDGTDLTVQVVVAPLENGWRARIVTAHSAMWVIPRTTVTMKFVHSSAIGARDLAVAYLTDAMPRAGYKSRATAEIATDHQDPPVERRGQEADLPCPEVATRKLHKLSARWGLNRPEQVANTGNLSMGGMFLVTDVPPEPGATVTVRLDIESCSMPLRGRVIWNRPAANRSQPPGMGISLIRPPALYREFVSRLTP